MKRAKRTIVILSLALAGCRGAITPPAATPQVFSLHMLATPATAPLLQELAAEYAPRGALISLRTVTLSGDAIAPQLRGGQAPYALVSAGAAAGLWAAPIGYDGIAVIVPADLLIDGLTVEQVRRLFLGRIATWDQAGGPALPVTVIAQEPGSDVSQAFQTQVMNGQRITLAARLALSSASMVELVARTPGAVGYVSMAALGEGVRAVPLGVEGGAPVTLSSASVSSGAYPLRAPIVIAGLSAPDQASAFHAWFAWMQSAEGQAVVARHYASLQP
ncbi:MAG: substrate-binding domain-containing protein [Anaerolineae bacterium]|nr:substrate-binding domain-containing protein [Anaerolineae bacterium]